MCEPSSDRAERRDVPGDHPGLVAEPAEGWQLWADEVGVDP